MLVPVAERSRVAEARRLATQEAAGQGFTPDDAGRVAIVATELATNLIKHGNGGEIAITRFDDGEGTGMEILALDKGPGIADVQKALTDGHSTAGSAGTGLGAIRRAADVFAISTAAGRGTAVVARLKPANQAPSRGRFVVSSICAPYPGETVCGDGWAVKTAGGICSVLLADGSGHGPEANKAATRAIDVFNEWADDTVEQAARRIDRALGATRGADDTVEQAARRIDRALGATRGAAIAIAEIAPRQVNFVGIGNISAAMTDEGAVRRMISNNGTAGHIAPRIRMFHYPFRGSPTVILHSDGLSARWDLSEYPGLVAAHPSLIAGILYRDFRRGRDDASIVVVRSNSECPPAS